MVTSARAGIQSKRIDIMLWFWAAVSAAALWGFSYALVENVFKSGLSSLTLMALYTWIALPIFTLAALQDGEMTKGLSIIKQNPKLMISIVAVVVCYLLGNLLVYWAIKQKNATSVSLIEITYPLFVVLFSYMLFNQQHLTLGTVLGGAVIMSGVGIMYFVK
jgi:drug/metabolite transporter (DMT)-like permease